MTPEPSPARSGLLGVLDRVQATARAVWSRQRRQRPWLDHLARGYRRYKSVNGDHLAAAITYFSFLALFPMILLGISIAAFVLLRDRDLLDKLEHTIAKNVPGPVGDTFSQVIDASLKHGGTIGLLGLLGVGYAGLGWIANLRAGVQIVWACETVEENPVKAKLEDLLALVGLGLGILASLTLTAGGTAVAGKLIELAGLAGTPGLGTAVAGVTILLAVGTDTLIFTWLFSRLPRRPVRLRSVLRGALFAAVGYEAIKLLGTFYLARVGANGLYGTFAGIVGLMIWINLVSRFLLFAAAWTATAAQPPGADGCADTPEPGFAVPVADRPAAGRPAAGGQAADAPRPEPVVARRNGAVHPAAVAGVLVGAGAALGAAATAAGRRLLRSRR